MNDIRLSAVLSAAATLYAARLPELTQQLAKLENQDGYGHDPKHLAKGLIILAREIRRQLDEANFWEVED